VQEGFLDAGLHAFAEEGAVRKDDSSAAAGLEDFHDEHEEEVGGLAGAELGGKIRLDAILLHAAKGRVGADEHSRVPSDSSREGGGRGCCRDGHSRGHRCRGA
jgi:hypothetical protein